VDIDLEGQLCVSCAWAKPAKPRPFEFCEEPAKAITWEITNRRCAPAFFAEHTVSSLASWSDHDLEEQGRLTHPLRWDAATDKYVPVGWAEAFDEMCPSAGKSVHGDRSQTLNGPWGVRAAQPSQTVNDALARLPRGAGSRKSPVRPPNRYRKIATYCCRRCGRATAHAPSRSG